MILAIHGTFFHGIFHFTYIYIYAIIYVGSQLDSNIHEYKDHGILAHYYISSTHLVYNNQ